MEKKYGKKSIKEREARGELFGEVGGEFSRFPEFRRIQQHNEEGGSGKDVYVYIRYVEENAAEIDDGQRGSTIFLL